MNTARALLLVCVALAQALLAPGAGAATFRGKAVGRNYGEGRAAGAYEVAFKIVTDGCDYAMELERTDSGAKQPGGTTTYWTRTNGVLYHSAIAPVDPARPGEVRCRGGIYSEHMPEPGHDPAPVLWTIYAWDCLAKDDPAPSSLRPVWAIEHDGMWNTGITLPAQLGFANPASARPGNIAFINDGRRRAIAPDGKRREYFDTPPFDRGYVNATIEMDLAELAPGVNGPRSAKYRRYAPRIGGSRTTNELHLVESVDIVTTESSAGREPISLPKLLAGATLHDSRHRKDLPFFMPAYTTVTDGRWSLPDPDFIERAKAEYLRIHPGFAPVGPVWKALRVTLFFAFLMATSITGALLVRWKVPRRHA